MAKANVVKIDIARPDLEDSAAEQIKPNSIVTLLGYKKVLIAELATSSRRARPTHQGSRQSRTMGVANLHALFGDIDDNILEQIKWPRRATENCSQRQRHLRVERKQARTMQPSLQATIRSILKLPIFG